MHMMNPGGDPCRLGLLAQQAAAGLGQPNPGQQVRGHNRPLARPRMLPAAHAGQPVISKRAEFQPLHRVSQALRANFSPGAAGTGRRPSRWNTGAPSRAFSTDVAVDIASSAW